MKGKKIELSKLSDRLVLFFNHGATSDTALKPEKQALHQKGHLVQMQDYIH